jgi:hypothetical protein
VAALGVAAQSAVCASAGQSSLISATSRVSFHCENGLYLPASQLSALAL